MATRHSRRQLTLEAAVTQAIEAFEGESRNLLAAIFHKAAEFYRDVADDDFCVYTITSAMIIFGAKNRLMWTPANGFLPMARHCTKTFLAHAIRLGFAPYTPTMRPV